MIFKLLTFLIIIMSSIAYSQDNNDIAEDRFGSKLENRWGEPVYIDPISNRLIDRNGNDTKREDIYRSNGGFTNFSDQPIYDRRGFEVDQLRKK